MAAICLEALQTPRPLVAPVEGDPDRAEPRPPRLPGSLAEADEALAGCQLLRDAMGEPLLGTLIEARRAEERRIAALSDEQQVASTRWWPLPGPVCAGVILRRAAWPHGS